MQSKKPLLWAILVSVGVFCVILVFSMFRHIEKIESEFNDKKATLIRKNMDLRDDLDSLQEEITQKAQVLTQLEEESQKVKAEYTTVLKTLKEQNISLAKKVEELVKKIKELKEKPLVQQLRTALYKEKNQNVRKFLEKVLYNIVLIKSGRSIELEPIVVAKKEEKKEEEKKIEEVVEGEIEEKKEEETLSGLEQTSAGRMPEQSQIEKPPLIAKKKGKVLSVDKKYNLIVIDLGRKDDVKEGERCMVVRDEEEIASAKVINVRYKVAAAFVDEPRYKYSIRNINEGDKVLFME